MFIKCENVFLDLKLASVQFFSDLTCGISIESVNMHLKFIHASLADVAQPKSDWKPEELATVGELLLDISIQLART